MDEITHDGLRHYSKVELPLGHPHSWPRESRRDYRSGRREDVDQPLGRNVENVGFP